MRVVTGIPSLIFKLYVGVFFFTSGLILYPIIYPFLFSVKNKKKAFQIFVFWSWWLRIMCFFHVKIDRKAPLPEGPYIILANHQSYLDIFLMYSILPGHPFLFLGKRELLKYPIVRTYFTKLNIPVYRRSRVKAARSLIRAKQEVKNGWSIVIFPEGGIPDVNPKMVRFKGGAFILAKQLGIPIVPMTYLNNHRLFSDPEQLLGTAHPGTSKVVLHPYISADEVKETTIKELSNRCFKIIEAPLKKRYPDL